MKCFKRTIVFSLFLVVNMSFVHAQSIEKNRAPKIQHIDYKASFRPDRILLTLTENPASEMMVTWRTKSEIEGLAEIVEVDSSYDFYENADNIEAISTNIITIEGEAVVYHKVKFSGLKPRTLYAYRVGDGTYWSEWSQFTTAEKAFQEPFRFIYMGDAQNDLFSLWSRATRASFKKAPNARFAIHAGDLINHSQNDYEWGEWFEAGGFIPKTMPVLATLGNHEYIKDSTKHKVGISTLWEPQFNFPKNGPENFEDRTYYVDYLNLRLICLDSNTDIEKQTHWLKEVLEKNKQKWVVVFFHHPIVSAAEGRFNKGILNSWKPLFDEFKVDLVLQGHDHVYGRGNKVDSGLEKWNEDSGTTYIVSVSGRKMYKLSDHEWMDRKGENIQLYQIITVHENHLNYKAYTLDDKLYDHFELKKQGKRNNRLNELPLNAAE